LRKLLFDWGISDNFGWGIYGANLIEHGIGNGNFQIVPLDWPPQFIYPINPLKILELQSYDKKLSQLSPSLNQNDVVMLYLGNQVRNKPQFKNTIKEVGVTFFELNPLPQSLITQMRQLNFVISGSTWNSNKLREMGIPNQLVIQGVDTDLFRPLKKRIYRDRFVIFSGGKLEFRKGQDILLAAYSIFAKKHADALLITCWRSPWEKGIANSVNQSGLCSPLQPEEDMGKAISRWVGENGVNLNQVINLDPVSNIHMPEILREVDLAVFPNRCEGGTNLVAMEALSSGIPCIISKNTGHLDLFRGNNCIPLERQAMVKNTLSDEPKNEWGESSVDELVELMEGVYSGAIQLNQSEIRNSIKDQTWEKAITDLLNIVEKI